MSHAKNPRTNPTMPGSVAWLGYGGLIPFIALATATALLSQDAHTVFAYGTRALFAYGAVILSFVGALHWAFAMTLNDLTAARRNGAFIWSVVPALLAWLALALAPVYAAALLIVGFLAQYAQDVALTRTVALPGWYLPLRRRLTTVACLCLALGGFAAHGISTAVAAVMPATSAMPATPAAPVTPVTPVTPSAMPDPATHYKEVPASPDGIGKSYEGREIAHVMGYEGATWLDRPTREQEERPDLLVEALHLKPGMTVADIGAGSGYLSRRLAVRVAPGQVWAVDVQPQMVALLANLSKQPGMSGIIPHLGAADNVMLPDASMDLALMVDVYHELEFPYEVMQSIVRALKPGGRMVFVEYRGEDPAVPIKALHKMTEAQVRREMRGLPLVWERTDERLPLQHLIVFRKPQQ